MTAILQISCAGALTVCVILAALILPIAVDPAEWNGWMGDLIDLARTAWATLWKSLA